MTWGTTAALLGPRPPFRLQLMQFSRVVPIPPSCSVQIFRLKEDLAPRKLQHPQGWVEAKEEGYSLVIMAHSLAAPFQPVHVTGGAHTCLGVMLPLKPFLS